MILCGFYETERIMVHPNDNLEESHWIDITKDKDEPTFYVTYCCDEDWIWEFGYDKTSYERIKHIITDCIFECDSMEELMDVLDEIFEEMLYGIDEEIDDEDDDDIDCCGDCDRCKYLN